MARQMTDHRKIVKYTQALTMLNTGIRGVIIDIQERGGRGWRLRTLEFEDLIKH
jgi:hypothetical protein